MGPAPLPLDLSLAGMPGCVAYMSAEALVPMTPLGPQATAPLPIPDNIDLVGTEFYLQALVPDPEANDFGATVTNARKAVIGSR